MKNFLLTANCLALFANERAVAFTHNSIATRSSNQPLVATNRGASFRHNHALHQSTDSEELAKAPTFNGQLILPIKVLMNGLKGHKVAAVYAVQSEKQNGWGGVKHITLTKDLYEDLEGLINVYGSQVAFVRALSFAYPQKVAMEEVAQRWAGMVMEEGGSFGFRSVEEKEELVKLMMETADYDDDDDDDDEFEFDDDEPVPLFVDETKAPSSAESAEVGVDSASEESDEIVSPFAEPNYSSTSDEKLEFNEKNVDTVLDEIRPYLISDGGNVSVHNVDTETRSVYLILEGACGSCASSTITMQQGIERILKENFENIGEVAQVVLEEEEAEGEGALMDAVMMEISRIGPAISAMVSLFIWRFNAHARGFDSIFVLLNH